jgi:hypothetical protein
MTRCCPFPRSPAREGLPIVVPKRQCFVDPPSPRHEPSTPERLHRASRCLTSASSRSISRAALATAASVDPLEERRRGARVRRHQTVQHLAQQRPEHGRRLIGGWPGFVFVVAVAVGAHALSFALHKQYARSAATTSAESTRIAASTARARGALARTQTRRWARSR